MQGHRDFGWPLQYTSMSPLVPLKAERAPVGAKRMSVPLSEGSLAHSERSELSEQPEDSPSPDRDPELQDSQSSSRRKSQSSSATKSSRKGRLSNRSRAGCWTCRGRKVKCDEVRPRCGPCTRLNRDCDWDHRWNFSDATSTTQGKYANVNIAGNVVWDPHARSSSFSTSPPVAPVPDVLPAFTALTSNEERERKAETHRPGTFGVVVTPDSFSDLPEYQASSPASSRKANSVRLRGDSPSMLGSPLSPASTIDPYTVVLDRFEDVTLASPIVASTSIPPRSSLPPQPASLPNSPHASPFQSVVPPRLSEPLDDPLLRHFRSYIVPRLVQPQHDSRLSIPSQGSCSDAFEREASRFPPLYQAICALCKLHLTYNGKSSLEEAMQHYHRALAVQTSTSPDALLSDGVFLRHFLLFVYDICLPVPAVDEDDHNATADMWAANLTQLRSIAVRRFLAHGTEPHGLAIWTLCELDLNACLMGNGNCEFVQTVLQHRMLPPLDQQIPCLAGGALQPSDTYLPEERAVFPQILGLYRGVVLHAAKMAQMAHAMRTEASDSCSQPTTEWFAKCQTLALQCAAELESFWSHAYPDFMALQDAALGVNLPPRVRVVFENALLLHHAATLYVRTSMFPGQRRLPLFSSPSLLADSEQRIALILSVVGRQVEVDQQLARRAAVFPLFIAGSASLRSDNKARALGLLHAFEGHGIGQNTTRMRLLLAAVGEEQRAAVARGGSEAEVEWMLVAAARRLRVVNCGL